ncbi:MAG: Ig-like domain-containing protein [Chitinophagales bacterium]
MKKINITLYLKFLVVFLCIGFNLGEINAQTYTVGTPSSATGTITNDDFPSVSSIVRADANPTNATTINFTVTFSHAVSGVDATDFVLTTTGSASGTVGTPTTSDNIVYNVPVSSVTGNGTIRLDVVDNNTIVNTGQPIGGNAANDGDFTTGEVYTIDNTAPTVTINQGSSQSDPTNTSPIVFDVVFSESVTGFATGDVTLGGTAGATTATVSGSGTTYTVSVTGMTGDGTVTASIAANVATDAAGNNNTSSTSTDNSVTYDTNAPTVTINQGSGQSDPTNTSPIVFDVVFSETVTGFATGDVTLGGTAPGTLTGTVAGSGTTYTVSVTGMTGDGTVIATIAANVAIDVVGNNNTASTSTDNSVTYDTTAPTVTINQGSSQSDPTNSSTIVFDVVFSETVADFATGDVTLGGTAGATTATVSGSGTTYTVSVTGMTGDGTVTASIDASVATDAAGNNNSASTSTDNSVTYDGTAPTVTINQGSSQSDPTNSSTIVFDVVFSETVTGFATGDVTLGGTAGATTATVTGSGTTYTVSVTGMTGDGTVIASIAASVATDAVGNNNTASTSTDNSVTYDTTAPTVTINQGSSQSDPTNSSTIVFDVVFSETVADFATGDVTLGGTAGATTATVSGSGTTYTVSVTGMTGDGTVTASIAASVATDAAGNNNAASTSTDNSVTYDVTAPTVTINQGSSQSDPTNSSTIVFDVVFSETVADFATGDVTLGGTAGATTATVSGSGTTYTVSVTGMTGDGTVTASIAASVATDAAGNNNAASTSTDNEVTYDGTAPTVTINQGSSQSDPTNSSTIVFDVVFSETVADFATGDVTLGGTAGATTATVSGSGTTYTVSVTGMTGDGTVTASIAASVATDAVGNNNAASTSTDNSVTYDTTAPTVTINQGSSQSDPTNSSTIVFDVVFSESVADFATGDVTLGGTAGATTATVSGSGTTYTVSVTGMTSDGTVIASIAASVATDAAGNNNAASTSTDNSVTYDTTAPTVTTFSPADGAESVLLGSNLVITFSENVVVGTGNITIHLVSNNNTEQTLDVTNGSLVSISNNVVTINPPTDFNPNTQYYVNIPNTAFVDAASNAFAGISNNSDWNFTSCACLPICSPLPTATGTYTGSFSETDGAGYTHFCDALGNLLLSVKIPAGGSIADNAVSLKINSPLVSFESIYCGVGNPFTGCFVSNANGAAILDKQWDINEGMTSSLTFPFNIVNYFTMNDITAIQAVEPGGYPTPVGGMSDIQFFKINDNNNSIPQFPDPSTVSGLKVIVVKNGGLSTGTWQLAPFLVVNGIGAEYKIGNIAGGAGIGGKIKTN